MNEPQPRDAFGEERFNQIIAEFLEAQQSGNEPKRETLLEQHPDLAEELKAFFADHDKMGALAQPLRPTEIIGARKNRSDGAAPPPGTMLRYFGDYELVEEIARGGMGVVYKARQISLNRTVAVKMILAGQLASEEDVQRFHSEAEAAAKLDHPGIVPIFEVGQHEGQHFFSMGFVDGESLATKVADGPLPPREAAQLTKMIAEAVTYAHGQGVIHRDLKPANVVLDSKGRPRVTDFGLAKRIAADSSLTATGQVIGTPSYMSPEQAAGKTDQIGKHSDVYSLGALLYCLLTGRPPFHAASVMETLNQVLEEEPVSPRQLNPAVNRDLDTICLKCLEKGPRARYNSAQELADELQRFLEGKPIVARPVGWAERAHRWCRRNPVVAGLSATVVLALLAGIVVSTYFAVQSDRNATRMAREYQRAEDLLEQKTALAGGLAVALKGQTAATERAERQQLRAEQMLYVNQIARARSEWESGNVAAAWESLDACRWDLRGWEHDYLYTLFNQNQQAFLGHTGPVYSVAFSPDGRRIVSGSLDNTLKLWNWSKHRNRSRVGH